MSDILALFALFAAWASSLNEGKPALYLLGGSMLLAVLWALARAGGAR